MYAEFQRLDLLSLQKNRRLPGGIDFMPLSVLMMFKRHTQLFQCSPTGFALFRMLSHWFSP